MLHTFELDGKKISLGDKARDTITGFEGTVICGTYWLNGCIRLSIQPNELKDGKVIESDCFDIQQIELIEEKKEVRKPTGGPSPKPKYYPDQK